MSQMWCMPGGPLSNVLRNASSTLDIRNRSLVWSKGCKFEASNLVAKMKLDPTAETVSVCLHFTFIFNKNPFFNLIWFISRSLSEGQVLI